jgi:hypothetical protein
MTTIDRLVGVQFYVVLNVPLTHFDHLGRDPEQRLVLSGISDQALERALRHVREKIERRFDTCAKRPDFTLDPERRGTNHPPSR